MKHSTSQSRAIPSKRVRAKTEPTRKATEQFTKEFGRTHPWQRYKLRARKQVSAKIIGYMFLEPSGIHPFTQQKEDEQEYLAKKKLGHNPFLPYFLLSERFYRVSREVAYEANTFHFNTMTDLAYFIDPFREENKIAAPATRKYIKNIELTLDGATNANAARELMAFIAPAEYPKLAAQAVIPQIYLSYLFALVPEMKALKINATLWPTKPGTAITDYATHAAENIAAGRTPMRFTLNYPNPSLESGGGGAERKPMMSMPVRRLLLPIILVEGFFAYMLRRLEKHRYQAWLFGQGLIYAVEDEYGN